MGRKSSDAAWRWRDEGNLLFVSDVNYEQCARIFWREDLYKDDLLEYACYLSRLNELLSPRVTEGYYDSSSAYKKFLIRSMKQLEATDVVLSIALMKGAICSVGVRDMKSPRRPNNLLSECSIVGKINRIRLINNHQYHHPSVETRLRRFLIFFGKYRGLTG
ncbi:hypothetical protein OROHE_014589 [Orobanche hederae]